MPLVSAAWSTQLYGILQGMGFMGSKLLDFTDAVAQGSVGHVVGKAFVTVDTGTVPGTGAGVGVGLSGFSPISSAIYAFAVASFGQAGSKLQDLCDAIGQAHNAQLALAALVSTHSPVFVGSGTVVPGSIPVVGTGWGSQVQAAAPGFVGSQWANFAQAIGKGCAAGYPTATGTVVISGSPSGVPVPGAGSGAGTIS